MRAAKVQASLRIRAVSPEPPLLAHTSTESRGTFRQKARSLAPLNGWACTVKICHDGMLEDTNSLDGAHLITETEVRKRPQVVAPTKTDVVDKSCEVGLLQCGSNADCVPKVNSKSKVGTCQCREGFVFDSGGKCVSSVLEKTVSNLIN